MKVLVLSNLYPPDFLGGYEIGCRQAADALAESGHDVLVLTSAPRLPAPSEPHVRRALQLTDVYNPYFQSKHHVVTLGLQHAAACFVNAFNVHVLLETLDSFGPDVVYVWNVVGLGGLGLMACLQYLGVPWVWHLMDRVPRDLCRLPLDAGRGPLAGVVCHYLEGTYLACSRRVIEEIDDPDNILNGSAELVPNWIEGERPLPRTRFFEGGRLRVAFAAAYLCPPKGVDLILEAAHQLRRRGRTDFVIDLYGKVMDDTYPSLIRRYDLGDCVRLQGLRTQRELAELYRAYDVFAFPTWEREPFGFAPLEAAAAGCVPVVTNNCGISEWLVHAVHCWKIERRAAALAGVLGDVLDGRIDLAPIGRRVADVVWRDFHIRRVLPRIERALTRAARQRRPARDDAPRAYHLAVLAEKLTQVLIEEWLAA
ncbi:MAG TPA: glycosyltransferase family 4 protein [Gemmataceae bacterium]|jgi:glycosyltransferase involved in cell wall biosynthesis